MVLRLNSSENSEQFLYAQGEIPRQDKLKGKEQKLFCIIIIRIFRIIKSNKYTN